MAEDTLDTPVDLDVKKKEFEENQRATAESQNLGEGSVPEARPQAMTVNDGPPHSELTQKLIDAGDPNVPDQNGPMDKAAYDRAASPEQAKKAAKASVTEGVHVGNVIRITGPEDSPHVGRTFAVTRIIKDPNPEATALRASGSPEQLYINPVEVEGRAIRDDRDGELNILNLAKLEFEKVRDGLGSLARR